MNLPFKFLRTVITWGTFGKDGIDPLEYVPIGNLSTEHINNILKTEKGHLGNEMTVLFKRELEYRK